MTLPAKILLGTAGIASTTLAGVGVLKLTSPKNVRETLISKNKVILSTESSQDQDEWNKVVEKAELKDGLKTFLSVNQEDLKTKIDDLRKKCEEQLKVEINDNKFPEALQNAEKYCVKI